MDSDLTETNASTWWRLKQHFTESFSGELLTRRSSRDNEKVDVWRESRRRNAYRYILVLFAVTVLPLAVQNILAGEVVTAIGTCLLLILVLLNIVSLSVRKKVLLSPFVVMFFSVGLVMLALSKDQGFALYLLFPLMVGAPILMKPRWALALVATSGVVLVPLLLAKFDLPTTIVIEGSLFLSWLASAWLVFAVTEQARRLREMAITDPLTGAYNRRYLEVQAGKCLETWARHQHQFSLLLLDIDHFKWINDKFGHAVGDKAIQSVVSLIKQRMRKVDVLCRYGGEEFVLLLSESNGEQAKDVANELRLAVEQASILPEGKMTVSIGVCDVVLAENPEHWLKMADVAMYLAKINGRNRVELATSAANAGSWTELQSTNPRTESQYMPLAT